MRVRAAKPRVFIPTLYFIEGLPFTVVNMLSVVFFKSLSMSNELIGIYTSLLYIPWTFKLFWAPLVDLYASRRFWIIAAEAGLAAVSVLLMVAVFVPNNTWLLLFLFALMAFVSATQDVAIDGYYLDVLDHDQQAFYVGVRGAAYKVAWLFGSGALVYLAGAMAEKLQVPAAASIGWCTAFGVCAIMFGIFAAFHGRVLPYTNSTPQQAKMDTLGEQILAEPSAEPQGSLEESDGEPTTEKDFIKAFPIIFKDFCDQPRIRVIFLYVLIFRLGDALLMKMAQPFLLDQQSVGGLGLTVADVGKIYGGVGTVFLLAGGMLGSALISKYGLQRFILPFAIIQNSSLLLYWFLAVHKPDILLVCGVNAFEQFSYGLGTSSYMVFLLSTVKPKYKASQFAIVTAFMALGVMVPGLASGFLQQFFGYANFFLFSFFVSLPGIITIPYLPLKQLAAQRTKV